jgi:dienelactone hydrolase
MTPGKRPAWALALTLAVALVGSACSHAAPSSSAVATASRATASVSAEAFAAQVTLARSLVAAMGSGDFAAVESHFTAEMQAAFPESALRQAWTGWVGQFGSYQDTGATSAGRLQGYVVVLVDARFSLGTIRLQFSFDASDRVAGFYREPADYVLPSSPAPATSPASYVRPGTFHESAGIIGQAPWQLPGTLTMPNGSGPFPAIVLVAGSGPNDRDETAGPNKPLRDLAWGLASAGIATLRYDKRTLVYGSTIAADSITVKEEVTDDAQAAIDMLRSTPGVDPTAVFLLGHSLGGYLAPRIAAATTHLRGIVILEGPTRPLQRLILAQYEYLASLEGSPSPEVQQRLDEVRAAVARIEAPDLSVSTPASQLLGVPASYWLDLRGYDPAASVSSLHLPMFLSQGGRDYQVTGVDFDGWRRALAGRSDVVLHEYPRMNHLLMNGTGPATPAEYQIPGHVASELVSDLAVWIKANAS